MERKIRELLMVVQDALKGFQAAYQKDMTSENLFNVFTELIKEGIGEYEILYDYIWGKDSLNIDGVTDEKYVPQIGDTLIMDISIGKDGVWCDICRTYFVGEPSVEQSAIYSLITRSLREGHKALKKGALACDIYNSVNSVYEENSKKLVHHAGHRIGEKPLMQPQFLQENQTPLVVGELYTIESGVYEKFGIRLENDFLLTEDGAIDLFEDLMPLEIEEYILK